MSTTPPSDERLQRFAQCPEDVRDWAERAGYENLKARLETSRIVSGQAATTLTLVLAGIGGSMAYGIKLFEPSPGPAVVGAAALCVWLVLVATILVLKCINLSAAPMLFNEPENLLVPEHTLADIRVGELANLQDRIEQQTRFNGQRARWLNRARALAICSPAVFVLAAWCYR